MWEASDFASYALDSGKLGKRYRLVLSPNTKMGFSLQSNFEHAPTLSNVGGVYALYRNDECYYVGGTSRNIHGRVARFIKEVMGRSTDFEDHPAAKKFRKMFGEKDLDKLFVSAVPLNVPDYVKIEDVEKLIMKVLKPIGNERK